MVLSAISFKQQLTINKRWIIHALLKRLRCRSPLCCIAYSREGTTEKVLNAIAEAAKIGVELIVFPETFIPYYPYFSFIQPPVLMGKEHMSLCEQAVEVPSIAPVRFPQQPKFYSLKTQAGIPYSQIALLHSHNVLATTVLQTCIRYNNRNSSCQFCAIEQSLAAGKTIPQKTPQQLAEVTAAAVRLDGVEYLVMTTGTPNTTDRGADYLSQYAQAVKARVNIPIQAQCEPPNDFSWFTKMKEAGIDSLGMHLEVIDLDVRDRIMPGKAKVSLDYYFQAFAVAVKVFGWGQVSTYILAGLGDSLETITTTCDRLINLSSTNETKLSIQTCLI